MKENPNNEASARYVLLEADRLETLVRTNYLLSKSLLAFEHLCSHSDRPMYLTARGVCEVLGISETELDESRLKRLIRAKVVQHRMMYDLYDLVQLAEPVPPPAATPFVAHSPLRRGTRKRRLTSRCLRTSFCVRFISAAPAAGQDSASP